MLDFFDLYLISFVLAYIARPWGLTFGQAGLVLLASGLGATIGAVFWGWVADRIGRRPMFTATIANFALATRASAAIPERGWVWLVLLRFLVGFWGYLVCAILARIPGWRVSFRSTATRHSFFRPT